jgi:hypothetical protein
MVSSGLKEVLIPFLLGIFDDFDSLSNSSFKEMVFFS